MSGRIDIIGKSLKGYAAGSVNVGDLGDSLTSATVAKTLNTVDIENFSLFSGTIDDATIGKFVQGFGGFSELVVGKEGGPSGPVTFWGGRLGDYVTWNPLAAAFNINGSLSVRDGAQIGNLRIIGNRLEAIAPSPDGNVILGPLGAGIIGLDGSTTQMKTGYLNFDKTSYLNVDASSTITLNASTNAQLTSRIGDVSLKTDYDASESSIVALAVVFDTVTQSFPTSGSGVVLLTTLTPHKLKPNDKIIVTGTTHINGYYSVLQTPNDVTLTIEVSGVPPDDWPLSATPYGNIEREFKGIINLISGAGVRMVTNKPLSFSSSGDRAQIVATQENAMTLQTDYLNVDDPIPQLRTPTGVYSDAGWQVSYLNKTIGENRVAFFGMVNDLEAFTWIPRATITRNPDGSKQVLGDRGSMSLNSIQVSEVIGDPDLLLRAPRDIILQAGRAIRFPLSIPLDFGGNGTLTPLANGNTVWASRGDLLISPTLSGRGILMANGSPISFNGGSQQIYGNASGLQITSSNVIQFQVPQSGFVGMPFNAPLAFATPLGGQNKIISTLSGLNIDAITALNLNASTSISVPLNIPVTFGGTTNSLRATSGGLALASSSGNVTIGSATGNVYLNVGNMLSTNAGTILTPDTTQILFGQLEGSNNSISVTPSTGMLIGASKDLTLRAPQAINLNAAIVNVPLDIPLVFGNRGRIVQQSNGTFLLSTTGNDSLTLNSGDVLINGNLRVTGTTTYVESTNSSFRDTLLELARNAPFGDVTDKGLIFNWWDGAYPKQGAFFWDMSAGKFVLANEVQNNNEVLDTRQLGSLDLATLTAQAVSTGDFKTNKITGVPDLYLVADGGSIFMQPTNNVFIPLNTPIRSGSNNITGTAEGWNIGGNVVSITGGNMSIGAATMRMEDLNNLHLGNVANVWINAQLHVPSTIKFGVAGQNQSQITVDEQDNLTLTSPSRIVATSPLALQAGFIMGNASMTYSTQFAGGRVIWQNTSPNSPLDVSLRGTIYDATWAGNSIGPDYGGTGHVGPWTKGSVVFAATNSTGTYLEENNDQFFWDNELLTLGIRTKTPKEALTLGSGNIEFDGKLLFRHTNLAAFSFGKHNVQNYLVLDTNMTPTVNYDNLSTRVLTITNTGVVGIGVTHSQMTALTGIATDPRLYVSGHVRFANTLNRLAWSTSQYLIGDAIGGIHVYSSLTTMRSHVMHLGDAQFLESTQRIYGTQNGRLHIASLQATFFRSPHNVFVGRCCLKHDPITNECQNFIEVDSDNNTLWQSSVGDIYLDPLSNVVINGEKSLLLGTAGQLKASGDDLHISSLTGSIILDPLDSVKSDKPFIFNTTTSLSVVNGVFSITTPLGIELNSDQYVSLPDRIPLRFGEAGEILSDNRNLILRSSNSVIADTNIFRITGNLIVDGTTTQRIFSETLVDSGIFQLGGGSTTRITDMTAWSPTSTLITTATSHYLIANDTLTISNSDPDIDGTYTVLEVPTATSLVIGVVPPTLQSGEVPQGNMRSAHVSDPNVDIGLQFNWHTGQVVGTQGARYSFVGMDRTTNRLTYLHGSQAPIGQFNGTLGDVEFGGLYLQRLSAPTLIGPMDANTQIVSGSAFRILGGSINNTPIGNTTPSTGVFTNLRVTGTMTVDSGNQVINLNADMVDGMHANEFIYRNGTTPLTGHWNAGSFGITSRDLTATSLYPTGIVFAGVNGLLTTSNLMTFDPTQNQLTVSKLGPTTLNGAIVGNNQSISGINLSASNITNSNLTLTSLGNVLDASAGTVIFRNGQINGNWLAGGVGAISVTGNAGTVTNGVYSTQFQANTILKADVAGTPIPLTVHEGTLVGRKAGGVIDDLTPAEARDLLNVAERGSETAYVSGAILRSGHLEYANGGTMTGLFTFSHERIIMQANTTAVTLDTHKQISYISVTYGAGVTVASVILPDGMMDGQMKWIIVTSLAAGIKLHIRCSLAPTNASGVAITGLLARTSRQSAQLIWDDVAKVWYNAIAGLQVTTI